MYTCTQWQCKSSWSLCRTLFASRLFFHSYCDVRFVLSSGPYDLWQKYYNLFYFHIMCAMHTVHKRVHTHTQFNDLHTDWYKYNSRRISWHFLCLLEFQFMFQLKYRAFGIIKHHNRVLYPSFIFFLTILSASLSVCVFLLSPSSSTSFSYLILSIVFSHFSLPFILFYLSIRDVFSLVFFLLFSHSMFFFASAVLYCSIHISESSLKQ